VLVIVLLALLAYAIVQMSGPQPVPRQLPQHPTDAPAAQVGRP
jgi:hypothetical protein